MRRRARPNPHRPQPKRPSGGPPKTGTNSGAGPNNSWNGCAETGASGASPSKKAESKLKNRNTVPAAINPAITLGAILAPGSDTGRWKTSQGARVEGFLITAKRAGQESCNCNSKDWRDWDIHLELVADKADADPRKRVIAEITSRWHDRLGQYGTLSVLQDAAAKMKKVRVSGWMFFDPDHRDESENTNPGGAKNWRATGWEVHPVTGFEVVS